jgi:RNA polymerase sigma-70 factor, ECF subfamily
MNNDELLRKLHFGKQEVFSELLKAYRDNVLNLCFRFLLNREDAEDVAQDVFIEVYYSIEKFRGDAKLSTWLYRIAVSKCLDEIKRKNRKKRISDFGKALGIDNLMHNIAGDDHADKRISEKEDYEFLMNALNKLPQKQRIALTLSKIEGHTPPEIADIMQTSLTAVDSLIYRAKQNLKTFLVRQTPEIVFKSAQYEQKKIRI